MCLGVKNISEKHFSGVRFFNTYVQNVQSFLKLISILLNEKNQNFEFIFYCSPLPLAPNKHS